MSFEYGVSNKNKPTVIHNGFEYTKKQATQSTVHWVCRYVKQFGCKSTIITCGNSIIKYPQEHCCRFVPGETEARKALSTMKASSLSVGNTEAIATGLSDVTENVCIQLAIPKKSLITRTLNRHRQKTNNEVHANPQNQQFDIPEEFKDFLLYDSGKEHCERIFVLWSENTSRSKHHPRLSECR